ncbi:MAG: hypothetical protein GX783_11935 [Clostridiales bacterium]|nr:hypothetical protein [Clostridiales bacterium]
MSRWLFGLNSFVLPIREVDVSYAPLLGRLCALMDKIPADYQLSFVKVLTYNWLKIHIFIIRLIGLT